VENRIRPFIPNCHAHFRNPVNRIRLIVAAAHNLATKLRKRDKISEYNHTSAAYEKTFRELEFYLNIN
jgi:hypothetical protein